MAVTTFKYATQTDLKNYFNGYDKFDQKTQIFPTETSGNNHFFRDSGLVTSFFVNGSEQASAQSDFDNVDGDGQWCYRSDNNDLKFQASYYTATTINEQIFEAGVDFATFIDQQLVNASLELNNLLDARFETPLPQVPQTDSVNGVASVTITPEYDPIIVKATCYIAAANLIRSRDPLDENAQAYYNMVTNIDGSGIVDRLNDGKAKLSYEVSENSKRGKIREVTRTGTMYLVDIAGEFVGGLNGYDLLKIECTTGGAYGVAKVSVFYYSDDKLFGESSGDQLISGGFDNLAGLFGLRVRFQGAAMAVGDTWEIEAHTEEIESSNTMTKNIKLSRI